MTKTTTQSRVAICLAVAIAGCADATGPDACSNDAAISLDAGVCLVFADDGLDAGRRATIETASRETVAAVQALMPLSNAVIRVTTATALVIPQLGIGGRAWGPDEIEMAVDPASPFVSQSLDVEWLPLLAHEMHHVLRMRTAGYGGNLFGAMISEGLADQFSVEVAGIDPPLWSAALTAEQLAIWSERAQEEWFAATYDHTGWFLGSDEEIPLWTGYTIGFELTRAFLETDGRSAAQLYAEPAASFIPPEAR